MTTVVVTGAAGYIGSHAAAVLADSGLDVVGVDNLSTGHEALIPTGCRFHRMDVRNTAALTQVLSGGVDAVIHFAGSALVGESAERPEDYFDNNTGGMVSLARATAAAGVKHVVFSSTCAVYGVPTEQPISEGCRPEPINAYGSSKLAAEQILRWWAARHGSTYTALRYFNVAGASRDALRGEWHTTETHIVPNVLRSAQRGTSVEVFGDDYATPDGTCIRDYIHVLDLVNAHVAALDYLLAGGPSQTVNLGTGRGTSVLEIVRCAEMITGLPVTFHVADRRPGDPDMLVADPSRAHEVLQWEATSSSIENILRDAWRWHSRVGFAADIEEISLAARLAPHAVTEGIRS